VPQTVEAKEPEMVLWAENSHVQVTKPHKPGVCVEIVDVVVIQEATSRVQIYERLELL